MESAIQKLAIVTFFVIGLSHIVQPRVWAQFFINIREKGATGSFIIAFIHFPLGALIVAFHNVSRSYQRSLQTDLLTRELGLHQAQRLIQNLM